jgi:hypothetical protein
VAMVMAGQALPADAAETVGLGPDEEAGGGQSSSQVRSTPLEQIQRKPRVREWTPQNAPRIRAGVEKKDQKAELKKNQIRRRYAEKTSIFF